MISVNGYQMPGPIINTTVFSLKVECSAANIFSIFEIQSRTLCDSVNHTFSTYAKVPNNLLYTNGPGSSIIPKPGSWIYTIGSDIYLQIIGGWISYGIATYISTGSCYVPTPILLYKLISIDPITLIGNFELVNTNSVIGTILNQQFQASGSYTPFLAYAESYGVNWTYGNIDGTNNLTTWTINDYNGIHSGQPDTQTITAIDTLLPFNTLGTNTKLSYTEIYEARKLISTGWYQVQATRLLQGSISDSFGNTVLVSENGNILQVAQPLLNGSIFDLNAFPCMPVSLNCYNTFGLFYGNYCTFNNFNTYNRSLGSISSAMKYQASDGKNYNYSGLFSRNSNTETLSGIWGTNSQAQVWSKYTNPKIIQIASLTYDRIKPYNTPYDYNDHYVVLSSDTTFSNKYPIFSYLDETDNSIIWISGIENPRAQLWKNNTLISVIDGSGRPANNQLWPRNELGPCNNRPSNGQLWPRTR